MRDGGIGNSLSANPQITNTTDAIVQITIVREFKNTVARTEKNIPVKPGDPLSLITEHDRLGGIVKIAVKGENQEHPLSFLKIDENMRKNLDRAKFNVIKQRNSAHREQGVLFEIVDVTSDVEKAGLSVSEGDPKETRGAASTSEGDKKEVRDEATIAQ